MDRQRVTFAALLAILPFAPDLPAQEVIDLPGRDQPLDADFEEIFRVGVREGEDWEMFANASSVAFDADGNLYVVDGLYHGMDTRIVVFDASGNFVREFGSMGEGPGEFNMPTAAVVMRDGTTVVEDLRHRAYQLFDANGGFVRMVRKRPLRLVRLRTEDHCCGSRRRGPRHPAAPGAQAGYARDGGSVQRDREQHGFGRESGYR